MLQPHSLTNFDLFNFFNLFTKFPEFAVAGRGLQCLRGSTTLSAGCGKAARRLPMKMTRVVKVIRVVRCVRVIRVGRVLRARRVLRLVRVPIEQQYWLKRVAKLGDS